MIKSPPRFRILLAQLIAAQACYYMIVSIDLTLTGLVGMSLASVPALMTLPLSLIVVIGTVCSFIAGHAAARFGYRPVMVTGALTVVVGGTVSAIAVASHSFSLFCVGTALTGGYRAVGGFLRFVASEYASPTKRERALALVMYGGIIAAALGPFAAVVASKAAEQPYLGSCILIAILGIVALVLAATMPPATGRNREAHNSAIRIRERIGNPTFQQAVLILAGSGLVMTLVMASGPLANDHAGHGSAVGAAMIQWHLVGMFAPSALSALLLKKYGAFKANVFGVSVIASGCAIGLISASGWGMTATMMLVGVGWNVLFVAGSALLLQSYPQGRGAKLQGFTDGATAAISAGGSFAAAWLLQSLGWNGINLLALAVIASILTNLVWLSIRARRAHALAAAQSSSLVASES
ncbi:MFS transporter [Glutamicibacter mishrai]|uniref:MFS transporter n=1 Tax=Glutamicibacter mishrai TaxID=1775880 RepID=UPI0032EECFF1